MFRFFLVMAIGTAIPSMASSLAGKWTGTIETNGSRMPVISDNKPAGRQVERFHRYRQWRKTGNNRKRQTNPGVSCGRLTSSRA